MTRHRWAWAAITTIAGTALGADPANEIRAPKVETATVPAIAAQPAADVVLPASETTWPRRPIRPPECEMPAKPIPGTWPPGTMPPTNVPPGTTPPQPGDPTDPRNRAPEAGTLSQGTFNPNMFGDQFSGSGSGLLARRVFLTIERNGATDQNEFAHYLGVVNTRQYRPHPDFPNDFPAQVTVEGRPLRVGSPIFASVNTVPPSAGIRTVNALYENSQVTAVLRTLAPHGTVTYISGKATETIDQSTSFTPHRIDVVYDISQVGLALALPPDGGMVGRTKLSDDNNPLPRDRVIFNYDYYANPALAAGLDVNRFSVGFEKTFFDMQASFEVRMPFASTLDNVTGAGGAIARDIELGNLFTALKGLFYSSDELNAAAGFAVSFPTGSDGILMAFDGREFVRVKNRSVLFAPFIAAAYAPGEHFFSQLWLQGSFDATGNPVYTDFDSAGLVRAGKLRDQARFAADMQLGYWVYRRPNVDGLRGVAPFFELHYNTTLTNSDQVQAPPTTVIGTTNRRFDEVNASIGLSALYGSNMLVSAGFAIPLRQEENRFFDYQFGIRVNYFYGPTAEARQNSNLPSGPMSVPSTFAYESNSTGDVQTASAEEPATQMPSAMPATTEPLIATENALTPGFFGDLVGISARPVLGASRFAQLPVVPRFSGMKVTDQDGPRLSDRYYFSMARATDVDGSVNAPGSPNIRLSRQIVGVETVFDDQFGVGLRLPFLQLSGSSDIEAREIGDLTAILKYAIVNDPCNGNVCTIGANITLPTGGRGNVAGSPLESDPLPRATFIQPWIGAVWNSGDLFVQGTSSLLLPMNPSYPSVFFNSLGTGYWVYRDASSAVVRGIAPVVELHLSNPLSIRGEGNPIVFNDQLNLTTGLFLQFTRLQIGTAVTIPLAGPRPYEVEGIFTASYMF